MTENRRTTRARSALAALADSALDPLDLLHEAALRIGRVVPFDCATVMTLDPETLLPTARQAFGAPSAMFASLARNEALTPDVNKFAELASSPVPVATLRGLGDAAARNSLRLQRILAPLGLRDELRVVFRAGGTSWGAASLMRATDASHFTLCERSFMAEIGADVGRALRGVVSRHEQAAPGVETSGPGVFILDRDLAVVSTTGEAERWRARTADDLGPALAVAALVAQSHGNGSLPVRPARTRVRLADGGWLVVRAGGLHGEPGRVAVTMQPAPYTELTTLLMHVRRLSVLERRTAELHLRGFTDDEITARLRISRRTLHALLLSVFRKVGVTGRPDLAAALLLDDDV